MSDVWKYFAGIVAGVAGTVALEGLNVWRDTAKFEAHLLQHEERLNRYDDRQNNMAQIIADHLKEHQ